MFYITITISIHIHLQINSPVYAHTHTPNTRSYACNVSQWNVDPSPYATRYKTIYNYENNLKPSGCKQYHAGLKQNTWKGK